MAEPVVNLGARLREARTASGMSLREVSRQLGVSPSFVSQLENGKSQPSVATLYSISQLLDVSIDELFAAQPGSTTSPATAVRTSVAGTDTGSPVSRSELGSPIDAFPRDGTPSRMAVSQPGRRPRLEMDTGVVWERLIDNSGADLDFLEITYPPDSSSTNDGRMLQHAGMELGYLLEGELEVTVGFDVFVLHAGEAVGFDPAQPHLFRNRGTVPARGIWCVRHPPA